MDFFRDMYLKNIIIWNFDWGGSTNRRFCSHEYVFWFTKKKDKYTFNLDDVKVPALNYRPDRYKTQLKNPTDVWKIPLVSGNSPERTDHPAQYPEELIERIIKVGTNPGDLVLNPFMGSGTTAAVAKKLGWGTNWKKNILRSQKNGYKMATQPYFKKAQPNVHQVKDCFYTIAECVETMKGMKKHSVNTMVTSPPYNLNKQYGKYDDDRSFAEWEDLIIRVADAAYDVLTEDGSFLLNVSPVPDKKTKEIGPLDALAIHHFQEAWLLLAE